MSCESRDVMEAAPTTVGCGCGCGGMPGRSGRKFLSREEEAERLTAYRQQLLREAAEVEKRISTLKKD